MDDEALGAACTPDSHDIFTCRCVEIQTARELGIIDVGSGGPPR